MGGFLIMLFFIIVCVILFVIKTSNNDGDELLRNSNTAASSTSDNETQTTDDAPNDGTTPTTAQGAPLTREELDRLLFKYHDKLFSTIVKAILMAMFIWSAIGGIVAGLIVAASVH